MPIAPRLYAIPAMPSLKTTPTPAPIDYDSPELWQKLDELKEAIRAAKAARVLPTVGDYLDSTEPANYCRHHDMYRPCQWCD